MKNKVLKGLCFAFFLIGIIISCRKEIADKSDESASDIMKARSWYENNCTSLQVFKSVDFARAKMHAKPDWKTSFSVDHKDFKTVEAPLSTQGQVGFATIESMQAYVETHDKRFMQSRTSLVILTNKKDNTTIGFLMTIIPEKDYRLRNNFNVLSSSYQNWQDGFSGYILYHNLDGSFSNGWKLSDGNLIMTVNQNYDINNNVQLESTSKSITLIKDCTDTYLVTTYVDCTDWFTQNIYTNTTCSNPYEVWQYLYTTCNYYGDGGGGGGGNIDGGYVTNHTSSTLQTSTPNVNSVYNGASDLSPNQKLYLEAALMNFKNANALLNNIWNRILAQGLTFKFTINPSVIPDGGLAAFLTDGTIAFRSEADINFNNLQEELIHADQYDHYGSRIDNLVRNFELEDKVIQDLGKVMAQSPGGFRVTANLNSSDSQDYTSWLVETLYSGSVDSNTFNHFCDVWSYPKPPNNYCNENFVPEVLISLLSTTILP